MPIGSIKSHILSVLIAAIFLLSANTAMAADAGDPGEISYVVEITGAPNGVENLMRQSSQLLSLRNRAPATQRALERRIERDVTQFRLVLESEGYYAGHVERTTEMRSGDILIRFVVSPGARYAIKNIQLDFGDEKSDVEVAMPQSRSYGPVLDALKGRPARAEAVIAAEDTVISEIQDHGFPFAERGNRQIKIDHDAQSIDIVSPVILGPFAALGVTFFEGLKTVEEGYLQTQLPWKPGEIFNSGQLESYRRTLVSSGLFTSVRVATGGAEELADGDALDINVDLSEAAHRSIGAGAKYGRERGFGGALFWEHRNLFGEAEKLRLSFDGTELDQTVAADLRKPNFLSRDQSLLVGVEAHHADTVAFDEWSGNVSAALERKFTETWKASAGASLEVASLRDDGVSRYSYLLGVPLSATYDTTGNILDPTEGWKVTLAATPFVGAFDGSVVFVRSRAKGNVYVPIDDERRMVLAALLNVGSMVGAATDQIPANRRFYGGGGGSVRGFGFQLVGPLDAAGEPTGGRSVIETALEARFRVSNTIGIVPFVDAGLVSLSSLPGKGAKLRAAAGIGARYYTAVGPLRLDIAIPINKRPGIDKGFQFYISFGQAF